MRRRPTPRSSRDHSSERKKSYAKGRRGGGGEKPRRRDALEPRRFRAVSPRLKAWRKTLVSRQARSPSKIANLFLKAGSISATGSRQQGLGGIQDRVPGFWYAGMDPDETSVKVSPCPSVMSIPASAPPV